MIEALKEARKAEQAEEIPIGAVVVKDGDIISRAHNRKQRDSNALMHAEIVAMNAACQKLGSKYLDGCDLYVTLEPCAMCAGAMINYRVSRLFFGAMEPKTGCCGSLYNLPADKRFNHRVEVNSGIMEEECASILKDFFAKRRKKG
ncbi:MAG: nucleoside deaminase [Clostridia bacterium]|nr:nucleoside deaminase [Clostridia bacterium]